MVQGIRQAAHCVGPRLSLKTGSSSSLKFAEKGLFVAVLPRKAAPVQARSFATGSSSQAPAHGNGTFETQFTSPRPSIPAEAHSVRRRGINPSDTTPVIDSVVLDKEGRVVGEELTPEEDTSYIPLPLSNQSLGVLYAFTTPPPVSALSALAHRLAATIDKNTSSHLSYSLVENLPLLEQCLIHESFWTGVQELPPPPKGSERIYTNFNDSPLATGTTPVHLHNGPLATLGNALLGALTSELLLSSFPHLPSRVTKAALTMYAGPKSLAAVASSWGVGPSRLERRLVGTPDATKQSKGDRAYGHLVGGVGPGKIEKSEFDGAAGMGLARWNRRPTTPTKDSVLFEDALASVSRSIIGAIYQLHGFEAMRSFVHSQFLSRLLPPTSTSLASPAASADIAPLLKFTSPSRVLSLTCTRYSMPPSTHRLLKESGRLSSHPTFLSGVFSGERKLGEGFGSSVRMSEWRASEDALRRLYLGGRNKGGLPSDPFVGKAFEGISIGESEVDQESKERSMRRVRPTGIVASSESVEESGKEATV